MKITFIRHGMTLGNALHQYIGITDQPLCPEGKTAIEEIRSSGLYPETDLVYVSPLIRCRQTAETLFPVAEQVIVEGLREMNFGVFEQRSYIDMEHDDVYQNWVSGKCEGPIPEGEKKSDFTDRCCAAFLELLQQLSAEKKESLVFVIHGGTIMALLSRFGKPAKDYYDWYVKNGHGYECEWDGQFLHILAEK